MAHIQVRLGQPVGALPANAGRKETKWSAMIEAGKSVPADGAWYPIYFRPDEAVDLARARRRLADALRPHGTYSTSIVREQNAILVCHLPPSEAKVSSQ